jgi:hypothetical protein
MKNKTLEPKTSSQPSPSPYQAERAEAQQTPVLRPDPLGGTLAPPGSEPTVRTHAAGLTPATAGLTVRRLQRLYGNRYVQRVVEQAQRRGSGEGFTLDDETAGRINRARGGGQSLDSAVQAQMSETLGHDFSGVRVHTDAEADALNLQLSARAFTTGHDIFFRRGAYETRSSSGRGLIAHELSHVVQQSTGQASGSGSGMSVQPAGDAFEQEAKRAEHGASQRAVSASPKKARALTRVLQRAYLSHKTNVCEKGQKPLGQPDAVRGAYFWAVDWKVTGQDNTGYVVQEVEETGKVEDDLAYKPYPKYWERWKVNDGKVEERGTWGNDTFTEPKNAESSSGETTKTGAAYFVETEKLGGTWHKSPKETHPAHGLEVTSQAPPIAQSLVIDQREIKAEWDGPNPEQYRIEVVGK